MPRHQEVSQNIRSFFSEKLVQVSLVSGVLFYIVANSATFAFVEKLLKQVLGVVGVNMSLKGEKLLIFHSFVFAILMGFVVKFLFFPLMAAWKSGEDRASYMEGVLEGYDKGKYVEPFGKHNKHKR
jgi:hypothetical protein